MAQSIDLNVFPYNDDFDVDKNYFKVLFKPGTPLQARELTTLQSILQNQIEKFGRHFFKEGSVVIPGNIAYDKFYESVQINDTYLEIPVIEYLELLRGKLIQGAISKVTAKVDYTINFEESSKNQNTLYIKYQSSSADTNFNSTKFIEGEELLVLEDLEYTFGVISSGGSFATTVSRECNSTGSVVKIEEGVYFIRGYFINVPSSTLILDQYTNTPSYRVGLEVIENFASASSDYLDLYDNSQGYSNYAAPGADRLVITTSLQKKELTDFNDINFIELLKVENGVLKNIAKNTQYNLILDELARRTYDESGNYYIQPFSINIKESLNNKIGNNGIYEKEELTSQGNVPSKDLLCASVSPGKAYIQGYEVETISSTLLDLDKPKETIKIENQKIPFNFGVQLELNNVSGIGQVFESVEEGYLEVDLKKSRVNSGINTIGTAKLYDFKLKNSQYLDNSSIFETSLFDIQLDTAITLSSSIGVSTSQVISGATSGAIGYVKESYTNQSTIRLIQVSGNFILNESIIIDGVNDNRIIDNIVDYSVDDILSINTSGISGISSLSGDVVLGRAIPLSSNDEYSLTIGGGIGTITTPVGFNFLNTLSVGDVISYALPGENLVRYHQITNIDNSLRSITLGIVTSVSNVAIGTFPTTSPITIRASKVINDSEDLIEDLYSVLPKNNIQSLDLSNSQLMGRKTYQVGITSLTSTSVTIPLDSSHILVNFDEEDYLLVSENGIIEPLTSRKVEISGKTLTLRSLTNIPTGNAYLTVTYIKTNLKVRNKALNKCSQLLITRTNTKLNTTGTGLTLSGVYGTRVEDKFISLNVPDVANVLAVYESTTSSSPTLPTISISPTISTLVVGEEIFGLTSNAVAKVVQVASNVISLVYLNSNRFNFGEIVEFQESSITATITNLTLGSALISSSYELDNGNRDSYLDFARIIRKDGVEPPTRRLLVVYDYYTIVSSDVGDFVSVDSYSPDLYESGIPKVGSYKGCDVIDFRPRVSPYNTSSSISPFHKNSRIFVKSNGSSPHNLVRNSSVILAFNCYQPRIDKIFVSKDGVFSTSRGVSSLVPIPPTAIGESLEIATLYYPPYVYNVEDIRIDYTSHKRYTMKDISRLENRISNIEYYTSLNLLESDTKNLTIVDPETQFNRFKCGFFVDNFSSTYSGDYDNSIFRAAIDKDNRLLKPREYATQLDLVLVQPPNNGNVIKVGDVICLNYTNVLYQKNEYASRSLNINPFNIVYWGGHIDLSPSSDTWMDTNVADVRITNVEGDYLDKIQKNNADPNTGLSQIHWESWRNNWVGSPVTNTNLVSSNTSSRSSTDSSRSNGRIRETTTTVRNTTNTFQATTTTQIGQSRSGIQNKVNESFETRTVGNRVLSRDVIPFMRSRNISIEATRFKPESKLYAYFDNINVSKYIVPKLIEIEMVSGVFSPGEVVSGSFGNIFLICQVCTPNHLEGSVTSPSRTFRRNPYVSNVSIPSVYSTTSSILNIDITTLALPGDDEFFGCISTGMILTGSTSLAVAKVKDVGIITDEYGSFYGSLHIPNPEINTNEKFETGNKTFKLSSLESLNAAPGLVVSEGSVIFSSNGILENVEENRLRIRNASVEIVPQTEDRTISQSSSRVFTTSSSSSSTNTRYRDPIAQSFEVKEKTGVYITKCDIFFRTKENAVNTPVTLQIREMINGYPSQYILDFANVQLFPEDVFVSEDASVATTFTFKSPVYLKGDNEYCIVLMSESDEYNVWISRVSERNITPATAEIDIFVSKQPTSGVLFKSQNSFTWSPVDTDDLKYQLYRAEFINTSGTVEFVNPNLTFRNNQIVKLEPSKIKVFSQTLNVSVNPGITQTLEIGDIITQVGNTNFTSKLSAYTGSIGVGLTLQIRNLGSGFNPNQTFNNVNVLSISGTGSGAIVTLNSNSSGGISTITVTDGGTGYSVGDVLTINTNTNQLRNTSGLEFIIPSGISNIISSFKNLILTDVSGSIDITSSNNLVKNGTTIPDSSPSNFQTLETGKRILVNHNNHGMHSVGDKVQLRGIEPDISPNILNTGITLTSTGIVLKNDPIGDFINFEGVAVSSSNLGYVSINNEIIAYDSVDISTKTLSIASRGIDSTITSLHAQNSIVLKYEFNAVSLRKLNKIHILTSNSVRDIKSYTIEIDGTQTFNQTKSTSLYNPIQSNQSRITASQNILFSKITPIVQKLTPEGTEITGKIRTITGKSSSGNETAYLDVGYEPISLEGSNTLNSLRMISSRVNQTGNNKTFRFEMVLRTEDSSISPMIDLDRVAAVFSTNIIDNPISNFKTDSRIRGFDSDPCSAIYLSKIIRLENPANSLKVLFDAVRPNSTDIRVAYRLFRSDTQPEYQNFELFSGYNTLNEGLPDRIVSISSNEDDFRPYEYTLYSPYEFIGFQIKIIMTGTNQAEIPSIRDLRSIATI
jgi:hypothetical protein